jgi:hypothetical protein
MDHRLIDHFYHRSRVDAHITGNILLVATVGVLALVAGERFKPFNYGAALFEPVRLVWVERSQDWVRESTLRQSNNFPPQDNRGPADVREICPISYSIVLVLGVGAIAYFIYTCARRQARLMNSVFSASDENRPYDRPWEEIRVTFWALDVALAFILFFFLA